MGRGSAGVMEIFVHIKFSKVIRDDEALALSLALVVSNIGLMVVFT